VKVGIIHIREGQRSEQAGRREHPPPPRRMRPGHTHGVDAAPRRVMGPRHRGPGSSTHQRCTRAAPAASGMTSNASATASTARVGSLCTAPGPPLPRTGRRPCREAPGRSPCRHVAPHPGHIGTLIIRAVTD
jgi:hypothetical protein